MTSENKETAVLIDQKGYMVLYKTDIKMTDSVIEINVKESSRIRFIELVQSKNNVETRITVSRHNFDEYVRYIKKMLKYSTLNSKSSSNATSSRPINKFGFKTELKTADKWHYTFELNLDVFERVLILTCPKDQYRTTIVLPVPILEEFVTRCEIILNTFGDISKTNAKSSAKHTSTKKALSDADLFPKASYCYVEKPFLIGLPNGEGSKRLEVLENPPPRQILYEEKSIILEIVKGNKTFLRITEKINGKIKESIHVPIECMKKFVKVFHEISNEVKEIENNA